MERIKDGTNFHKMQFEYGSNTMDGSYNYKGIKERLEKIYKALEDQWQVEWVK